MLTFTILFSTAFPNFPQSIYLPTGLECLVLKLLYPIRWFLSYKKYFLTMHSPFSWCSLYSSWFLIYYTCIFCWYNLSFMIIAEEQTRVNNNIRYKRRREPPNRTIINCDLYINLEGSSSAPVKAFCYMSYCFMFNVSFGSYHLKKISCWICTN